jgi:hypothetical protein
MGGTDADDNVQGLCHECHARKTVIEDMSNQASAPHPAWLRQSQIPITIVCGPPGAGKSTYVRDHAAPGDITIDLDDICASISQQWRPWSGDQSTRRNILEPALRIRNSRLGSLHSTPAVAGVAAWFVVSAPFLNERRWWARKLGGTVVLLDPGPQVCKTRALARGTPHAIAGIERWYRHAKQVWSPRTEKKIIRHSRIGLDGWPA